MKIVLKKETGLTLKESWSFSLFDNNLVFVSWVKEVKPRGKKKWVIECSWDKYANRGIEPELTEIIKIEALQLLMEHIKVQTWKEWKAIQHCRSTTNFSKNQKKVMRNQISKEIRERAKICSEQKVGERTYYKGKIIYQEVKSERGVFLMATNGENRLAFKNHYRKMKKLYRENKPNGMAAVDGYAITNQ